MYIYCNKVTYRSFQVLNWQISVNFDNKDSFFYRALKVLELYNPPDIISLIQELPTKTAWKSLVNRTFMTYWRDLILQDAQCKSTLKFLAHDNISLGEVHPVWVSTENSVTDVRKAIIKARILTETCLLQTNIHRFSQYI